MTMVGEGVTVDIGVAFDIGLEWGVADDGLGAGPGVTCRGWQAANNKDEM